MKKIILMSALFIAFASSAQIKVVNVEKPVLVGKIAPLGMFMESLEFYKESNRYLFTYKDMKFTTLEVRKSFEFKNDDNALDNLYNMIIAGFENPPKEDIMIELPNDIVWLRFERSVGVMCFFFVHAVNKDANVLGISQGITKKQVTKLFGKN